MCNGRAKIIRATWTLCTCIDSFAAKMFSTRRAFQCGVPP